MANQLPDPAPLAPNHDQAMAGPGRVIDVQTPNRTYGPEIVGQPEPDGFWSRPGSDYPPGSPR